MILTTLALTASIAAAPTADQPVVLEAMNATFVRNPQVFDVRKGVDLRNKYEAIPAAARDAIELAFYLVPKGKQAEHDLSQVELGIDTTESFLDVPLHPTWRIDLPQIPSHLVDKTELFSNQPKRSIEIVYKIDVAPDAPNALSVARAERAVSQARAAWKAVLPGLAKATVPKFNCVEFLFAGSGAVSAAGAQLGQGESVKVPLGDIPQGTTELTWDGQLNRIAACKD